MADSEPQKSVAEDAPLQSAEAPDSGAVPEPKSEPKPEIKPEPKSTVAPTSASPASRPLYIPQFTAATRMILKRMKGEPSSLSAALSQASRSPSVTANIPSVTYEDVKRRLVMGMNTSTQMTMQMPAVAPARPPPMTLPVPKPAPVKPTSTAGMSAIRKVTAGLTGISKSTLKATAAKVITTDTRIKKTKIPTIPRASGTKRKRTKAQDDDDASSVSSSSELSGTETPAERATPTAPLTMTKSGRQIQKPAAYNPAAMDAASKKRPNYGKRTAEQALCKKCTRMHSPTTNQIVFCDGCNEGWHQLCHEPWIHDDVVRDQTRAWFCAACQEKRDRERQYHHHQQPKKQKVSDQPRPRESWASRPPQQKRAYLSTLPQQELVGLIMACLEIYPDLPVFPGTESTTPTTTDAGPRSLFAGTTTEGLFPRVDAHPNGQINFVRKITKGGKNGNGNGNGKTQKEDSQERKTAEEEDDEFDPLAPLWPKPGMGLYRRLPPDTGDEERLVDEGDFEAFSVIVYDERGRKVEENGMRV